MTIRTCRPLLFAALTALSSLAVGCTEKSSCELAADHLRECFGEQATVSPTCTAAEAENVLAQDCDALADSQKKQDGFSDFLCSVFGISCPQCSDMGGVCLSSPLDTTFSADCAGDWGSEAIDIACPSVNQTCCVRPFSCRDDGVCLPGAEPSVSFVDSEETIYFLEDSALSSIAIDGDDKETLFSSSIGGIVDLSDDTRTIALEDSDTSLFISRNHQTPVKVDIGPRAGEVAVSPDGSKVAVTLHPDFSLPQSAWQDFDTVLVIDADTLDIETLEGQEVDGPTLHLAWSEDGTEILLHNFDFSYQRVSVADGSRTRGLQSWPPADIRSKPFWFDHGCALDGRTLELSFEGDVLELAMPGQDPEVLVRAYGYDPAQAGPARRAPITKAVFSPSCEHVIFGFDSKLWVIDTNTGEMGFLHEGFGPFNLP